MCSSSLYDDPFSSKIFRNETWCCSRANRQMNWKRCFTISQEWCSIIPYNQDFLFGSWDQGTKQKISCDLGMAFMRTWICFDLKLYAGNMANIDPRLPASRMFPHVSIPPVSHFFPSFPSPSPPCSPHFPRHQELLGFTPGDDALARTRGGQLLHEGRVVVRLLERWKMVIY